MIEKERERVKLTERETFKERGSEIGERGEERASNQEE